NLHLISAFFGKNVKANGGFSFDVLLFIIRFNFDVIMEDIPPSQEFIVASAEPVLTGKFFYTVENFAIHAKSCQKKNGYNAFHPKSKLKNEGTILKRFSV